ncbi:MAG: hypothetical protein HY673_21460 [Chloroflexi bacterium]|nr:hypothetical protein [Chloroflexota bacterium]
MQLASKVGQYLNQYVEKVKTLEYVREVRVVANGAGCPTVWTIIEAPAFEDSWLRPIFEAEKQILRTRDVPLDFELVNMSEYPDKTGLTDVAPTSARSVWRR